MALEVAVTTDRFVKKTGLVSIETEEVSLDKIEEVNVGETIIGRIFGYGTVDVHGTGAGAIHIKMIDDPVRLRREIQSAREQLQVEGRVATGLRSRSGVACRAEARGSTARLRPTGFGAAAFTRVPRAKAGGPGRTRTCDQTVMSGPL